MSPRHHPDVSAQVEHYIAISSAKSPIVIIRLRDTATTYDRYEEWKASRAQKHVFKEDSFRAY